MRERRRREVAAGGRLVGLPARRRAGLVARSAMSSLDACITVRSGPCDGAGGLSESLIIRPIASATAEGLEPIDGRDALELCSPDWMLLELSWRCPLWSAGSSPLHDAY